MVGNLEDMFSRDAAFMIVIVHGSYINQQSLIQCTGRTNCYEILIEKQTQDNV